MRFLYMLLPFYAIWNLPGFMNILSALRLPKTHRCKIRGYTSYVYFYPLIPLTCILCLLAAMGVPVFPLAVIWILAQFAAEVVATEDVKGPAALGAIGVIFGIVALIIGFEVAGYDVGAWFSSVFRKFTPTMATGSFLLLACLRAIMMLSLWLRVSVKSAITIDGNNFNAIEIFRSTPYPVSEWRLRAKITDWYERYWLGAVDLVLLANWGPIE